ncbi:MAG: histidine phosphatase family protein [Actinobacteria bacterium]|nr:histidine phosphatase family protein [Actinomycetota bacterium]
MERLILVRHAESVFNVRGVLNADPSVPGGLTQRGREQARRLGRLLAEERIDLCVTTAFERTRETADVAFAGRDIPRLVLRELDDPPNGDFEQLSRPEPTIVAVLHGWLVGWIAGAATGGGGSMPGHATPHEIERAQLERALGELRRDPYRYG